MHRLLFPAPRKPELPLIAISGAVLLFSLLYAYALVFLIAYPGLQFTPRPEGWIIVENDTCVMPGDWCPSTAELQIGDVIIQIGDLTYEAYRANRGLVPFEHLLPADNVALVVIRGDERLTVQWTMPPVTASERLTRLAGSLLLLPFWIGGTLILLFLRPRNERWRLLVTFNYLTAAWLSTGFISVWQFGYASLVLHVLTWFLLPVYLHLHIALPTYLLRARRKKWVVGPYLLALVMVVLEIAHLLPHQTYLLGFLGAVLGSITLLCVRLLWHRQQSDLPATRLMLAGIGFALGPSVGMVIGATAFGGLPSQASLYIALLVIPVLPFSYGYALYKRRLGSLEFRANQLLSLYSYGLVALTLFTLTITIGFRLVAGMRPSLLFFYGLMSVLGFFFLALLLQPRYQRWVDRLAYGITYQPEEIVPAVANRLSGMTEMSPVLTLVTEEIAPSLLVRESAMLLAKNGRLEVLYATTPAGVNAPLPDDLIDRLIPYTGRFLPDPPAPAGAFHWVRLIIPLNIHRDVRGLWLLGRRDPDDYYPRQDIELLQTLGNQLSSVMENIQLLEVVQRQLMEQSALLAASRAVASTLDWETVLSRVAEVLGRAVDATSAYICGYDSENLTITVLAEYFSPEATAPETISDLGVVYKSSLLGREEAEWAMAEYLTNHVNDPSVLEDAREHMQLYGAQSELVIPLSSKSAFWGYAVLWESRYHRDFTRSEITLCQAISRQVALAFENARLFRAEAQRRQEAELLAALAEGLASTFDLEEALRRAAAAIQHYVSGEQNVAISTLEQDGQYLLTRINLTTSPNLALAQVGELVAVADTAICRRVLQTHQPIIINDVQQYVGEDFEEILQRNRILAGGRLRALLYVPLMARGEPLGILHLNVFDTPRNFRQNEIQFCVNVANQAVTAIDNARLFEAERRQLRLAQTLQKVGALLTTQLTLEEVFDQIFDLLANVLDYDSVSIQLDGPDGIRRIAAGRGFPDLELARRVIAELGPQQGDKTITDDMQGLVIADTYADSRWIRYPGTEYIRSWAGIPLRVKGHTIGVLNIDNMTPCAYDGSIIANIAAFANQAAVAIENARLYQEAQERANELTILHQLALATAAVMEMDDLFRMTTAMIVERLLYPSFGFLLVDESREYLVPHYSFHGLRSRAIHKKIPIAGTFVGRSVLAAQAQYMSSAHLVAGLEDFELGIVAVVCAPILIEQRVIGVLLAASDDAQAFLETDVRFLSTLAAQVAGAIERARLYNMLQNDAARLATKVSDQTVLLREERDRMQAILDNAGEGVFFTNPAGIILYVNQAAMRLTGFEMAEVMGRPYLNWLGNQVSSATRRELEQAIAEGRNWSGELTGQRKTGTTYDISLTLAHIRSVSGEVTGFVGVQSDITRLKEIDRLRSELIANISHELRTPMTNIKTYTALLQRGRPENRERHLQILEQETGRLARLIEGLLNFSRYESGNPVLAPLVVTGLVRRVVAVFYAKAEEKQIRLVTDIPAGLPAIMADEHQLGQVLTNLIDNALTYTLPGGHITVSASVAEHDQRPMLNLRVADDGVGIAAQDLPYIFERLYRGKTALGGRVPGTGLGLAISREIVRRHGGQIAVQSQEGEGAVFTVWLPLPSETTEKAMAQPQVAN